MAQVYERDTWLLYNLQALNDRNDYHAEQLDNYAALPQDVGKIIELGCEAAMTISYWCPQAKTTGCPRVLFLSFDEPAFKRR